MEKIRKMVNVCSNTFFFDADAVIEIRKKDYLGFWNGNMKFSFNAKTKFITIYYDYTQELANSYEITYHSIKDERKLKLEKINGSG